MVVPFTVEITCVYLSSFLVQSRLTKSWLHQLFSRSIVLNLLKIDWVYEETSGIVICTSLVVLPPSYTRACPSGTYFLDNLSLKQDRVLRIEQSNHHLRLALCSCWAEWLRAFSHFLIRNILGHFYPIVINRQQKPTLQAHARF